MDSAKDVILVHRSLALLPRHLHALAFLVLFFIHGTSASDLYTDISIAVSARDAYVKSMPFSASLLYKAGQPQLSLDSMQRLLQDVPDLENPWYHFLLGLAAAKTQSNEHFSRALSLAGENPGLAWILAYEFNRHGKLNLQDSALNSLRRQLLAQGSTATPLIAQQLMHMGIETEQAGAGGTRLYSWAKTFDMCSIWPSVRLGVDAFPDRISDCMTQAGELLRLFRTSWVAQVSLATYALQWMRLAVLILISALVVPLAIRRGREAIHQFAEQYPQSVSLRLRQILAAAVITSTILLGFLPFILTVSLVIWPRLVRKERAMTVFAVFLIALLPAISITRDLVATVGAPDSAPRLFARSVCEGADSPLDSMVQARAGANPRDYLCQMSAGVMALKRNDPAAARAHLDKAAVQRPDDPAVLVTSAIADVGNGDIESGKTLLQKCITLYPRNAAALFNLGQSSIEGMETLDGMDLISRASRLDPGQVNSFMELNDRYFPGERPLVRRFIITDYPVSYFWKSVFPRYCGDWRSATNSWGDTLLGVPPVPAAAALSLLLLILLALTIRTQTGQPRVRKLLACEVCGATMCRKCSKGLYCRTCFEQLRTIRDDHQRSVIKQQINKSRRNTDQVIGCVLDMVLPGSGGMYERRKQIMPVLALAAFSAGLYAVLLTGSAAVFAYPRWVARGCLVPLTAVTAAFCAAFIIRGAVKIALTFKTGGEPHGS